MILNGTVFASLNLYRIFREISSGYIGEKMIQCLIILNIHYIYTFLSTNIAQQIIDHNNSIFVTVYNGYWYVVPLHVQKLILFLLQRGTKTLKIMIGGLFIGSLEGFATIKSLLEQLQDVCNKLKDENEIAIIEKCGSKAKCYTIAIIRKTMCLACAVKVL
ncbi:PREDICTED: uncharacterized protein LOC108689615 [Atta colombica]|uniref:uncharacterized protein LOC108689615 n=1 Tax=Atta colombica TaxID=520822 RepID=UPI00084C0ADE|nr:PREDICTED: uncharacterized protein LOC108689615 [Atta colombica]